MDILNRIKMALRISHDKLDEDVQSDIDACLADLRLVGVSVDATDPLIFNAVKLWCRSLYTTDADKAAEWLKRYESLKACLMMASGYGRPSEEADDE